MRPDLGDDLVEMVHVPKVAIAITVVSSLASDAQLEAVFGMAAVFTMSAMSGFSSVYFESILKPKVASDAKAGQVISIWGRNFQLALFSLLLLFTILGWEMTQRDAETPYVPLAGWSGVAVVVVLLQASGGCSMSCGTRPCGSELRPAASRCRTT